MSNPTLNRITRAAAIAIAAFCTLPAATQSPAPVKICPLGDSIIESFAGKASARYYLDQHLRNAGYAFDFVGHNHGVFAGEPMHPDFDQDHEAYSGWKLDEVLPMLEGWMQDTVPDVVLIHLGTNDMLGFQTEASSVVQLGECVDIIRSVNPHATVMISKLIKMTWRNVNFLNVLLPALVDAKDTPESRVVLVDHYTGFLLESYLQPDGLHPNDDGERFMAQVWFDTLRDFLAPAAVDATTFGTGCAGDAASAPTLTPIRGQAASLGQTFGQVLGSVPVGATAYGLLGIHTQSINLTELGAPDCLLLVTPLGVMPLETAGETSQWTLTVPQEPALVGAVLYSQVAYTAPSLNALGVILSNAMKFTVVEGG